MDIVNLNLIDYMVERDELNLLIVDLYKEISLIINHYLEANNTELSMLSTLIQLIPEYLSTHKPPQEITERQITFDIFLSIEIVFELIAFQKSDTRKTFTKILLCKLSKVSYNDYLSLKLKYNTNYRENLTALKSIIIKEYAHCYNTKTYYAIRNIVHKNMLQKIHLLPDDLYNNLSLITNKYLEYYQLTQIELNCKSYKLYKDILIYILRSVFNFYMKTIEIFLFIATGNGRGFAFYECIKEKLNNDINFKNLVNKCIYYITEQFPHIHFRNKKKNIETQLTTLPSKQNLLFFANTVLEAACDYYYITIDELKEEIKINNIHRLEYEYKQCCQLATQVLKDILQINFTPKLFTDLFNVSMFTNMQGYLDNFVINNEFVEDYDFFTLGLFTYEFLNAYKKYLQNYDRINSLNKLQNKIIVNNSLNKIDLSNINIQDMTDMFDKINRISSIVLKYFDLDSSALVKVKNNLSKNIKYILIYILNYLEVGHLIISKYLNIDILKIDRTIIDAFYFVSTDPVCIEDFREIKRILREEYNIFIV